MSWWVSSMVLRAPGGESVEVVREPLEACFLEPSRIEVVMHSVAAAWGLELVSWRVVELGAADAAAKAVPA